MFVQSEEFFEAYGGKLVDVTILGQEANPTTWHLAAMKLATRGVDFNLDREPADTFTRNQFPGLRADFIRANPPFNRGLATLRDTLLHRLISGRLRLPQAIEEGPA